jgi:lipopolysaccharide export system permease protein
VLKELIPIFMMGALLVVMMFQINFFMALGKQDFLRVVPFKAIAKIILLETPGFLNMTLPMAVALSVSLTMTRLTRESELVALRSAGAPIMRIVLPTAVFGLCVGFLNFFIVDKINPIASKASIELQTNAGVLSGVARFVSNVPLKIKEYTVSVGAVVPNKDETIDLRDVLLISRPEPTLINIVSAPIGRYERGLWIFTNAKTWTIRSGASGITEAQTKQLVINQAFALSDILNFQQSTELSTKDLRLKIKQLKQLGQSTKKQEIQYHFRFSIPAMCLIFAIVSPIFSISLAKYGGFMGVVVSVALAGLYFNAWVVSSQILGENPNVSPAVAAWLPNILFVVIGIVGLKKLE